MTDPGFSQDLLSEATGPVGAFVVEGPLVPFGICSMGKGVCCGAKSSDGDAPLPGGAEFGHRSVVPFAHARIEDDEIRGIEGLDVGQAADIVRINELVVLVH